MMAISDAFQAQVLFCHLFYKPFSTLYCVHTRSSACLNSAVYTFIGLNVVKIVS